MGVAGTSQSVRSSLGLSSLKGLGVDCKKAHHSLYGTKEARKEAFSELWPELFSVGNAGEDWVVLMGLLYIEASE